jgi:signal transduction histidine kinase
VVGRVWSFRDISERERLLRRALFLSDATRLLASLDVDSALDSVAHLAVPAIGDGCAIDLFGNGGPRRLIAVSRDPARPISPEVHPTVMGGQSAIYQLGTVSYLGVPLVSKGTVVGAVTLAAAPHRKYTAADLELAEDLASRATLAIDNARLYQRARDALRARDELLTIAAHEIRGPTTGIHLAVQSIRKTKVPPQSVPRLLELIEKEDRRLTHFVDELLDVGRMRAGTFHLDIQEVDLGDVVHSTVARLGPQITASGSSLTMSVEGGIVGQWDKTRIDQVVTNLLSNAIKFGLGKPIEINVTGRGSRAVLTVTDHGLGIERGMQARLFKPFERGVSVRHYGGLGLGLHIVKTIVDALGGTVSVTSDPGLGSAFSVNLPRSGATAERDAHPDH